MSTHSLCSYVGFKCEPYDETVLFQNSFHIFLNTQSSAYLQIHLVFVTRMHAFKRDRVTAMSIGVCPFCC